MKERICSECGHPRRALPRHRSGPGGRLIVCSARCPREAKRQYNRLHVTRSRAKRERLGTPATPPVFHAGALRPRLCCACGGGEAIDTQSLTDTRDARARLYCRLCGRDRWVTLLTMPEGDLAYLRNRKMDTARLANAVRSLG